MSDTLEIFGQEYTNVTGFKAKNDSGVTLAYVRPQGKLTVNQNGSDIDVTQYASLDVNVSGGGTPSLQSKTAAPSTSAQTIEPDTGYDGLSSVTISAIQTQTKSVTPTESAQTVTPDAGKYLSSVSVGAVSSTYVGSGIDQNDAGDLSADGQYVTVKPGYYPVQVSRGIATGGCAVPDTTIIASPTITVSASGLITAVASASESITPSVSPGYIPRDGGSSGTVTVSGSNTEQLETQAAQTVTPSKSQQSVGGAGKYMLGAVTVAAIPSQYQNVSTVNAAAGDVVSGKKIVAADGTEITGSLVIQHYYVSTSEPTASDGVDGDIWLVTGA